MPRFRNGGSLWFWILLGASWAQVPPFLWDTIIICIAVIQRTRGHHWDADRETDKGHRTIWWLNSYIKWNPGPQKTGNLDCITITSSRNNLNLLACKLRVSECCGFFYFKNGFSNKSPDAFSWNWRGTWTAFMMVSRLVWMPMPFLRAKRALFFENSYTNITAQRRIGGFRESPIRCPFSFLKRTT